MQAESGRNSEVGSWLTNDTWEDEVEHDPPHTHEIDLGRDRCHHRTVGGWGALCFLPTLEEPKWQRYQTARAVPDSSSLLPKGTHGQLTWAPNTNSPKVRVGQSGCAPRGMPVPRSGTSLFPSSAQNRGPGSPAPRQAPTQAPPPDRGPSDSRGLPPAPGAVHHEAASLWQKPTQHGMLGEGRGRKQQNELNVQSPGGP